MKILKTFVLKLKIGMRTDIESLNQHAMDCLRTQVIKMQTGLRSAMSF